MNANKYMYRVRVLSFLSTIVNFHEQISLERKRNNTSFPVAYKKKKKFFANLFSEKFL